MNFMKAVVVILVVIIVALLVALMVTKNNLKVATNRLNRTTNQLKASKPYLLKKIYDVAVVNDDGTTSCVKKICLLFDTRLTRLEDEQTMCLFDVLDRFFEDPAVELNRFYSRERFGILVPLSSTEQNLSSESSSIIVEDLNGTAYSILI